jgi:enoyl-CoA hydratase/crotonobetainyl-CoA hydratase
MSVLTDFRDNVLTVTINRPEAGNALNGEVGEGLVAAFKRAEDDDVRAVILTGAGEKIFCAGMDLKAFASGDGIAKVGAGMGALRTCKKPLIAAVNGHALAGGFELVLNCDLVVSVDGVRFGIPEVKRGLYAAGGGTRLARRVPIAVALEMGLTGDPITPQRAMELGLINQVVPREELLTAAEALAARITCNGPLAVRWTKELMWDELGEPDAAKNQEATAKVFSSEDAKEGATAFAEKRQPVWKNR